MEIFLVGGAIRDEMLGLEVHEKDWVVVGAKPQELKDLHFKQVGKSFPVFLHPETKEEYALARTELKVGRGYHGFEFEFSPDVTLEEDLARRDLTINAMAKNEAGDLIDPYNGIEDIRARILRHVSDAFAEDPVRVLRLARFASKLEHLGFQLADETKEMVWSMVKSGELEHLVPERVWKETEKALKGKGPVAFLRTLRQTRALSVIYPEIDKLYGVAQTAKIHPEIDTGIHVELVLWQAARLSGLPEVRFAALMHDLGKGLTAKSDLPRHPNHGMAGLPVLKALCDRLKVPNKYRGLAELVMRTHIDCHQIVDKSAKEILRFIEECDAFRKPERFRQMLMVCEADSRGRLGFEHVDYEPRSLLEDAFYAVDFINAKDVLKDLDIDVADIKQALFDARLAEVEKVKQRRAQKQSDN